MTRYVTQTAVEMIMNIANVARTRLGPWVHHCAASVKIRN